MALKIGFRDASKDASEAALDILFGLAIAGVQQDFAHLGAWGRGHLLGAEHQGEAPALGGQEIKCAVNRRGSGRTGVLIAGDRLEAQLRHRLQNEGAGEALIREAFAEDAHEAGIDLGRANAGILDRGAPDTGQQAFQVRLLGLAEGRVGPADDAGFRCGHGNTPPSIL